MVGLYSHTGHQPELTRKLNFTGARSTEPRKGTFSLPTEITCEVRFFEDDRSLTSASSGIGTSITQGKWPPKTGPLVSVSPGGSYSDESGRSLFS